tara:strand:+ start:83 stop:676 length:594 start_codon:yes stop_codon:yes gene_type:complete
MNLAFFNTDLEKNVVKEIMKWSSDVLEQPHPFFMNFSPCPFAKQAWFADRVAILFKYENNYQCLYSTISQFDDNFDVALIVDLDNNKNADDFHEYLDGLNEVIADGVFIDRDIWLMGFHPDDDPEEYAEDAAFTPVVDTEYAIIFVQRLSKLQEAADKLRKKGYYEAYAKEYNVYQIYSRRDQLYRRLKNGDETKKN